MSLWRESMTAGLRLKIPSNPPSTVHSPHWIIHELFVNSDHLHCLSFIANTIMSSNYFVCMIVWLLLSYHLFTINVCTFTQVNPIFLPLLAQNFNVSCQSGMFLCIKMFITLPLSPSISVASVLSQPLLTHRLHFHFLFPSVSCVSGLLDRQPIVSAVSTLLPLFLYYVF